MCHGLYIPAIHDLTLCSGYNKHCTSRIFRCTNEWGTRLEGWILACPEIYAEAAGVG